MPNMQQSLKVECKIVKRIIVKDNRGICIFSHFAQEIFLSIPIVARISTKEWTKKLVSLKMCSMHRVFFADSPNSLLLQNRWTKKDGENLATLSPICLKLYYAHTRHTNIDFRLTYSFSVKRFFQVNHWKDLRYKKIIQIHGFTHLVMLSLIQTMKMKSRNLQICAQLKYSWFAITGV